MNTRSPKPAATPEPVTGEVGDLAGLAAAVKQHEDEAARHTDEAKRLKEKIAAELGHQPGTFPAGDLEITYMGPRKTFDATQFVEAYPPATNAHMYKQVPASTQLDPEMIPPKLKQRFMVPGTGNGTVKIK